MKIKIGLLVLIALTSASPVFAHGMSDSDKQRMLDGGYLQYVSLGATHMLTGYDHLLFLFGVMFFLTKFKDIVKFVTAFTLGHSITLIGATFMGISVNYFLIDAVIALTVFYKGFDNIDGFKKYLNTASPNLIALVFIFGLIHGFGLSTRLQQLPLGEEGLLMRIISFNVGVEAGQILALSVMLLILTTWRKGKSFSKFSAASNVGLMIAGTFLFLIQMHGFAHEVSVDNLALAFSTDAHNKAHQELKDTAATTVVAKEVAADKKLLVPLQAQNSQWKDTITLTIAAGKSIEYKFQILKGELFEYSWKTNGEKLFFDFHGEPKGDKTGAFESFKKSTDSESSGSFNVPFEGVHGWYWKNKGTQAVTVTLQTKGSYEILGVR